jgi:hypothetical protein
MSSTSAPVLETKEKSLLAGPGGRPLRRSWIRLALFLLPIVVLLGPVIYEVDAYCYFLHASPIPTAVRSKYGLYVNAVLWKLISYNREPKPNIMLGDSQMERLPADAVEAATGEPYANLAYPGGTLRESIDTFWYADRRTRLRRVYFEISFMAYTAKLQNRFPQAKDILGNPLAYFVDSDVMEASAYDISDTFFHHPINIEPKVSKDAFWQDQLHYLEGRYKRDADPGSLREQLKQIVDHCKANGIDFTFVITPQSMDAQREVEKLGVGDQYRHFKSDLAGMAKVYDCDVESDLTANKDNFLDPLHMEDFASKRLVGDLWSGHSQLCRTLGVH